MRADTPTQAEQFLVSYVEEYSTLYPNMLHVFISNILGTSSDWYWENGVLKESECTLKRKDDDDNIKLEIPHARYSHVHPYNLRSTFSIDYSVSPYSTNPIDGMPDDMSEDWIDMITICLDVIKRITPEEYRTIVTAYEVFNNYMQEYKDMVIDRKCTNYETFYPKIDGFLARLKVIEDTRRIGKIPAYTYEAMYI